MFDSHSFRRRQHGPIFLSVSLLVNECTWYGIETYLADAILKLRLTRVHTPQQDDLFPKTPQCRYRLYNIHALKVHPEHHTCTHVTHCS
mmetsp:Transcript_45948/g.91068  ORF Transcript_45948/g.91068 Transcript_45948/m.91068 type:complete len:89 (+) Transcript_45948:223-489(+)